MAYPCVKRLRHRLQTSCKTKAAPVRAPPSSSIRSACRIGRGILLKSPVALFGLVDIPEHRRRRAVDHASQGFPPGTRNEELSERDVDHLIIGLFLDLGGELLLVFQRRGARELIAQLLDRGVLGPAEPAAILALSTDREVRYRIVHVGADPVGEEHVPAALLRRLLAGAA